MTAGDLIQSAATGLFGVVASAAFWGYWKDRRSAKAQGDVAAATVEIQVEAQGLVNAEKRFALAESAWNEERISLQRENDRLTGLLATERAERAAAEMAAEEKIKRLEARLHGMQRELTELTDEIAAFRRMREKRRTTD
jgi:hypothetical protein